jgi:GAF domain-containing protein
LADYPDHLAEGIAELSRLLVNEESLDDTLQRVADLACRTIGGADVAGVTLIQDGRPSTAVFTNPASPEIDAVQYRTGKGPCLSAFAEQQVFRVDCMDEDERWPEFSRAAQHHGVQSTVSFPLAVRGNAIGALNLYSWKQASFSAEHERVGLLFAEQASIALANAQLYASAYRVTQQLQEALSSRAVIDQAKGILMAQRGISADEAFLVLRTTSQHENRKVRELAQELVERAAARCTGGDARGEAARAMGS